MRIQNNKLEAFKKTLDYAIEDVTQGKVTLSHHDIAELSGSCNVPENCLTSYDGASIHKALQERDLDGYEHIETRSIYGNLLFIINKW